MTHTEEILVMVLAVSIITNMILSAIAFAGRDR